MQRKLRFAIFGNEYQTRKSDSAARLLEGLRQRDAVIFVERVFHEFLRCHHGSEPVMAAMWDELQTFDRLDFPVDYAISMGGDGTLLKTAAHVGSSGVPIIGVNTGRLGFLADFLPDEMDEALSELYEGRCLVEDHAAIGVSGRLLGEGGVSVDLDGDGYPYALNDIAVLKRDNASMITIHARVNGEPLVTYQADGLIVSTPTGSTAYNLSNGGPVMAPGTGVLCLTPVAPHSLNVRPIVVNDDCEIELAVESRTHSFLVAVDGRSVPFAEGTRLTIRRADHRVLIVKRPQSSYFATLRRKMMWGMDVR